MQEARARCAPERKRVLDCARNGATTVQALLTKSHAELQSWRSALPIPAIQQEIQALEAKVSLRRHCHRASLQAHSTSLQRGRHSCRTWCPQLPALTSKVESLQTGAVLVTAEERAAAEKVRQAGAAARQPRKQACSAHDGPLGAMHVCAGAHRRWRTRWSTGAGARAPSATSGACSCRGCSDLQSPAQGTPPPACRATVACAPQGLSGRVHGWPQGQRGARP